MSVSRPSGAYLVSEPDPTQGVAMGFLGAPFQGDNSRSRCETTVSGGRLKAAAANVTDQFSRHTTLQALVAVMAWDITRRFPELCPGIMGLSKSWQRGRALKRCQRMGGIQDFSDRISLTCPSNLVDEQWSVQRHVSRLDALRYGTPAWRSEDRGVLLGLGHSPTTLVTGRP